MRVVGHSASLRQPPPEALASWAFTKTCPGYTGTLLAEAPLVYLAGCLAPAGRYPLRMRHRRSAACRACGVGPAGADVRHAATPGRQVRFLLSMTLFVIMFMASTLHEGWHHEARQPTSQLPELIAGADAGHSHGASSALRSIDGFRQHALLHRLSAGRGFLTAPGWRPRFACSAAWALLCFACPCAPIRRLYHDPPTTPAVPDRLAVEGIPFLLQPGNRKTALVYLLAGLRPGYRQGLIGTGRSLAASVAPCCAHHRLRGPTGSVFTRRVRAVSRGDP